MKIPLLPTVEPGTYHARLLGVTETQHDEYGPGARWDFEIDQGEHAGTTVSRTTQHVATQQNACGRFCEMVSGLPLKAAVKHSSDQWNGSSGRIVVESSPTGDGVRVKSFSRDEEADNGGNGSSPF